MTAIDDNLEPERRFPIKRIVAAALLLPVFAVVAFVALGVWFTEAPANPLSRLERLNVGMTRSEVISLLGKPTSSYTDSDGSEEWTYSRFTWALLSVDFSPQGRVVEFYHDR